jgi:hypothetical protein
MGKSGLIPIEGSDRQAACLARNFHHPDLG